ncbi:MAG: pyridoxal 5'-phosphate synthase glutaminase subunit PdxT [Prevotella sp.]|nr:pyridoxal 5'-phosphate synthase glutaminase subunit PdxT [Prevotella sp.]
MRIAVMALQGAFAEHEQVLRRLGAETFQVRQLSDWQQPKDGVVLPGGESTVQVRLLRRLGLLEPVRSAIAGGLPVLATCAGLILLAKEEQGQPRQGLCTMDIDVCRNAYGRQLGSFCTCGPVEGIAGSFPMTFIRAPYVRELRSPNVEVLSRVDGRIVGVRQHNQIAVAFHPELTADDRLHALFLDIARKREHSA